MTVIHSLDLNRFESGPISTANRLAGGPYASPIWYTFEGAEFSAFVEARGAKAFHLARDPRFALTIDDRQWPYRGIIVRGTAGESEFDEGLARAMAIRYLGRKRGSAVHQAMTKNTERVRIRLRPEAIYSWDFSSPVEESSRV